MNPTVHNCLIELNLIASTFYSDVTLSSDVAQFRRGIENEHFGNGLFIISVNTQHRTSHEQSTWSFQLVLLLDNLTFCFTPKTYDEGGWSVDLFLSDSFLDLLFPILALPDPSSTFLVLPRSPKVSGPFQSTCLVSLIFANMLLPTSVVKFIPCLFLLTLHLHFLYLLLVFKFSC